MNDAPVQEGFREGEAARVLERAAAIEARHGGEVSVDELRQAAIEAGIPHDAFEQAVSELRSMLPAPPSETPVGSAAAPLTPKPSFGVLGTTLRRTGLITLGAGLAWLAYALSGVFGVDETVTIQFSLILAFFSACGIVLARRPARDVLNFEFDLASLWVGLTLVWMLFDPTDAAAVLAQMGLIGGIAGIAGAVLVGRRRPSVSDSLTAPDPDGGMLGRPTGDSL